MNDGLDYYRGSLDGAQQILIYATELLGNAIDMCERHLMCERWPNDEHPLCGMYSDAALEFHRIVSELCVRIDQARAAARASECAVRNLYLHRADEEADA